ncbi:MAG: hypothetical protein JXA20_07910 [Spirochaetes bacterium]|nr:hypothetical protein [Spirochaetota bacterium]
MQPDLDKLKNRVQQNRDLVARITTHVPGFTGYVEKAELYDTDAIVRGFLADRIQEMKGEISSLSAELVRRGEHGAVSEMETLNVALERLFKKCRHTDFGKPAELSHVAIGDEETNRLLEYDWRLISTLDEILPAVRGLASADPGALGGAIRDVAAKLKEFEKSFDERKNVILEVI